ncbi:MAG: MerC family mercury resistance protein [Limisphaerales bacterium]
MIIVELIYDSDCPNVVGTRENLVRAFAKAGIAAKWKEWERSNPETPQYARQFGSPAILINGQDIGDLKGDSGASCRLYGTGAVSSCGIPPVGLIEKALTRGFIQSKGAGLYRVKLHLPAIPAILVALLPKLACPACWPAYAGLMSALGLGFLVRTEYLLPLTAAFVGVALAGLWYRAEKRRGYWPLCVGILGGTALLLGKFWIESDLLFYASLLTLVAASLWNTWPRISKRSHQNAGYYKSAGELNYARQRKVDVFSAGCPACEQAIALINRRS